MNLLLVLLSYISIANAQQLSLRPHSQLSNSCPRTLLNSRTKISNKYASLRRMNKELLMTPLPAVEAFKPHQSDVRYSQAEVDTVRDAFRDIHKTYNRRETVKVADWSREIIGATETENIFMTRERHDSFVLLRPAMSTVTENILDKKLSDVEIGMQNWDDVLFKGENVEEQIYTYAALKKSLGRWTWANEKELPIVVVGEVSISNLN